MSERQSALSTSFDDRCSVCKDELVAMQVVEIRDAQSAVCLDRSSQKTTVVETALVDPVNVGDLLLVHAGVAVACLPAGDGEA